MALNLGPGVHNRPEGDNSAWLNLHAENVLDPARPICDPHHHLWEMEKHRYLLPDLERGSRSDRREFPALRVTESRRAVAIDRSRSRRPVAGERWLRRRPGRILSVPAADDAHRQIGSAALLLVPIADHDVQNSAHQAHHQTAHERRKEANRLCRYRAGHA
jgi:hypothetical protein